MKDAEEVQIGNMSETERGTELEGTLRGATGKEAGRVQGEGPRAQEARAGSGSKELRLLSVDHILEQGLQELSEQIGRRRLRRPDQLLRAVFRHAEERFEARVVYDPYWYTAMEEIWSRLSGGSWWRLNWAEAMERLRELKKDADFISQQETLLTTHGAPDIGRERFERMCLLFEQSCVVGMKREEKVRQVMDGLMTSVARGGVAGGLGYGIALGVTELQVALHERTASSDRLRRRYEEIRRVLMGHWSEELALEGRIDDREAARSGLEIKEGLEKTVREGVEAVREGMEAATGVEAASKETSKERGVEPVQSTNNLTGAPGLAIASGTDGTDKADDVTREVGSEHVRVRIRDRTRFS